MKFIVDGLEYPVMVGDDAPRLVAQLARQRGSNAIVVSDRTVCARAGEVADAVRAAGCDVLSVLSIGAGERHKRLQTVVELQTAFIAAGADRATQLIAVGGGTLSDTVGFAAATFLRGVPWIVVATTVLGMVDAAIGGKTGVNRPEGKNLVGAMWQPAGVVADVSTITTLPVRERRTGMAEVVKAAVIGDPELLDIIDTFDLKSNPAAWMPLITRAAAVKVAIVARDPWERAERQMLNLGHTFGHAIELASKFRMAHGSAVALGLRAAGIVAKDRTGWPHADHRRMLHALRRCGLPLHARGLDGDAIVQAMRMDKKRADGEVRFVLPEKLGVVRYGCPMPEGAVRGALRELASPVASGGW